MDPQYGRQSRKERKRSLRNGENWEKLVGKLEIHLSFVFMKI